MKNQKDDIFWTILYSKLLIHIKKSVTQYKLTVISSTWNQ